MEQNNWNKFPEEQRTFETRLLFIKELFTNTYERHQIMASCINYKLGKSYEAYLKEIHRELWFLNGKDPMAILKRLDK